MSGPRAHATAAMRPKLRWGQLWRLALRDLWYERWLAFCTACVVAAALAPLWTLWGLEQGVIGALIERQNSDPLMRQVLPQSSGGKRFDAAWFDRVRGWPEVAFVVPGTRAIASQVDLFSEHAAAPVRVDLLPTGPQDPFLVALPVPVGAEILLSASAAQRLGVASGGRVRMALERQRGGITEVAAVDLNVRDVLPAARLDTVGALAALDFLEAVQGWRDGYVVEDFGPQGNGPLPGLASYPLFRMHAVSIHDVASLVARLEAEDIHTYSRVREVDATLGLQRNLRGILLLIGAISCVGAAVALAALQLATVRRKRREYALLKLTGHGRAWLMLMPCLQALVLAVCGTVLALGFFGAAAMAINLYFSSQMAAGEAAVRMGWASAALGGAAAILVSMLPALWAGWRASCVEAADELREV